MRQLFIDAGHSKKYPGANGEDTRNGELVDCIVAYSQKIGWKIVRVPRDFSNDRSSSSNLLHRIAWINARCKDGDWLLSVHGNASTSSQANGVETCYMGGSEYMHQMAIKLTKRVCEEADMKVRGDGSYPDTRPTASGRSRIAMVRDTIPPALLLEAGFVTNGKDKAVPLTVIAKAVSDWFEDLNGGWYKDLKI